MKCAKPILLSALALLGLAACGDGVTIQEPPLDKREVTILLLDTKKAENPVLTFRAENMALSAVLQKVGALSPSQTIVLRCEGGYNKQPPLYAFEFDIVGAKGATENLQGMGDANTMHEVCMQKARKHLEYLRDHASKELDYYR